MSATTAPPLAAGEATTAASAVVEREEEEQKVTEETEGAAGEVEADDTTDVSEEDTVIAPEVVAEEVPPSGQDLRPHAEQAHEQARQAAAKRVRQSAALPPGLRERLAATERFTQMLVHGLVKESELINLDARARQQLGTRFTLDKERSPQAGVLMHPRGIYRKSANYTVTADDNGLLFLATAAVTFTLPTKANGLAFRFVQSADANLVISGSSDIIALNNAAANSVTFGTAGQKIGSQVLVECIYTNTATLKWLVTNIGATTPTVA